MLNGGLPCVWEDWVDRIGDRVVLKSRWDYGEGRSGINHKWDPGRGVETAWQVFIGLDCVGFGLDWIGCNAWLSKMGVILMNE